MKRIPLENSLCGRRGAVLVLVLVVLTIAAVVTLEIFFSTRAAVLESGTRLAVLRRRLALRSGLVAARAILDRDAATSKLDSLSEAWAKSQEFAFDGGVRVRFQLADEQGKLNVNRIRLRDPQGRPTPECRAVEALLERHGLVLPDPKAPALWPLEDLAQLVPPERRSVRPIYGDAIFAATSEGSLRQWFTVYGPGGVNVNTAPREVLSALLDGRDPGVADRLLRRREERPLENLAELRSWSGLRPELLAELDRLLSVSSRWFSALLVAEDPAGRNLALAVFERTSEGTLVRRWKEL